MQKSLHNKIKPCGGYWDYENADQSRRAALKVEDRKEIKSEIDDLIHDKYYDVFKGLAEK